MNKRIKLKKAKQKIEFLNNTLKHSRSVSNRLSDDKLELSRLIQVKDGQIRDLQIKMCERPAMTSLHMSDNRTGLRREDPFSSVESLRREFEVGPLRIRHDGPMTESDVLRMADEMARAVHEQFLHKAFPLVDGGYRRG